MQNETEIPTTFIVYASEILGETKAGLSGSVIAKHCTSFAIDFDVQIPYSEYPFPPNLSNKRTALLKNLKAFTPEQQFQIINFLCTLPSLEKNQPVKNLRIKLVSKYGFLATSSEIGKVDEAIIEDTIHWLNEYPEVLKLYKESVNKLKNKLFMRNLLDDLRLAFELLLKNILNNGKSIEKQQKELGIYIKNKNCSKEMGNMYLKLSDYYSKYQNTYVKHDDQVNENEIDFIFELSSSFMKFIIKIK